MTASGRTRPAPTVSPDIAAANAAYVASLNLPPLSDAQARRIVGVLGARTEMDETVSTSAA